MTEKATPPTKSRGPIQTFLGIIVRPRRTMAGLSTAKRRWWWLPMLLMLAALALQGNFYARANSELMYRYQVDFLESMPEQARGPMAELPPKTDPHPLSIWLPVGGRAVGTLVTWLVWAGLIALASTFLGHNGARFGGYFAMIAWARLPFTLRDLVQGITMAMTGRAIYNQGLSGLVLDGTPAPMTSGFRSYTPPPRGAQILSALLGRVDVYIVWSLVLTGIGIWAFGHLPRRRAILVVLGIWVIATVVNLLPALLGLGQGTRIF
jgi:Yip1-like protein